MRMTHSFSLRPMSLFYFLELALVMSLTGQFLSECQTRSFTSVVDLHMFFANIRCTCCILFHMNTSKVASWPVPGGMSVGLEALLVMSAIALLLRICVRGALPRYNLLHCICSNYGTPHVLLVHQKRHINRFASLHMSQVQWKHCVAYRYGI